MKLLRKADYEPNRYCSGSALESDDESQVEIGIKEHMLEKPKFHFVAEKEPSRDARELALLTQRFADAYKEYVAIRFASSKEPQLYERRLTVRSELARIALLLFEQSSDLEEFEDRLTELLSDAAQVSLYDTSAFLNGLGIGELDELPENEPTPIEAAWNTMENLKIANEIKTICQDTSSGIVVSGANAWGPFFEVRGPVPEKFHNHTIERESREHPSDIDMLITCETMQDMKTTIDNLIDRGVLSADERDRFDFFLKAHSTQAVDVFSVRSSYKGVEQSIHFVPRETLHDISTRQGKEGEEDIQFVRDFRPNYPGNLRKHGYYPILNYATGQISEFHPTIVPIQDNGRNLGYICESPTGSGARVGVLEFFLLISPIILSEQGETISRAREELRARLKEALNGNMPVAITREERMLEEVAAHVKKFISS